MQIRGIFASLCVASLGAGLIYAAPAGQIQVQVNLVNLFATVRDNHKAIVTALRQDDFHVYEDGQRQEISNFSTDSNLPITLGLLIDTSVSETYMLSAEKDAASRFLSRLLRDRDLAMVITFDVDVDLLADFTDDRSVLDRAISRAEIAPSGGRLVAQGPFQIGGNGGTDFYDAIYLAAHDKLSSEAGRKAIVVLTDAEDTGSKLKLQDAIEAAQRSDTVVHVLLISADGGDEHVAKKLTEETGGRMIVVRSERNLEEAFDQLSEELRYQYSLGYAPSNKARNGSYRKIRVETVDRGYSVLTRRGYYGPSD